MWVLSGIWLVIVTGILCQGGHWWGLALLPAAALHFYLAQRLGRAIQSKREAGSRPPSPPSRASRYFDCQAPSAAVTAAAGQPWRSLWRTDAVDRERCDLGRGCERPVAELISGRSKA